MVLPGNRVLPGMDNGKENPLITSLREKDVVRGVLADSTIEAPSTVADHEQSSAYVAFTVPCRISLLL